MSDRGRMAASTFLTEGRFRLALVVMVALRWLMLLLFLFNVPPLEPRNQWLMWPGADQDRIYFAAHWMLRGRAWRTEAGLGQVLVMAFLSSLQKLPLWVHYIRPWTGRHFSWVSYLDILPEMVMLNAFLLGGLSIVLVGLMGRDVTRRKSIGLTAAALWLLYPYIIWLVTRQYTLSAFLPRAQGPDVAWMNGMPDGPAVFFVLLSSWLAWRSMQRGGRWLLPLLGYALTASILFRAVMFPTVLWIWGLVAYKRGWQDALRVSVAAALAYLPQAIYNQAAFGFPVTSGYLYIGTYPERPRDFLHDPVSSFILFGLNYLPGSARKVIENAPILVPALLIGGIVFGLALVWLWRERGRESALLLATPLPYLALVVTFLSFGTEPVRYTMLVPPYVMIGGVYVLYGLWRRIVAGPATGY